MTTTPVNPADPSLAGAVFAKKGEFVTRRIAGETILVPVRGQVGDLDSIYNLNDAATFIWERLDGVSTARSIADAMTAEFSVEREQAVSDTLEFLAMLETSGIAVVSAPAQLASAPAQLSSAAAQLASAPAQQ